MCGEGQEGGRWCEGKEGGREVSGVGLQGEEGGKSGRGDQVKEGR